MNINDLMIGNIVEYNGMYLPIYSIYNKMPRINERYNEKELVDLVCDGFITASIDEIQPVKLSNKIFKSYGFILKHDEIIDLHEWISEDGLICINNLSNSRTKDFHVHIDNKDFDTIASADIQYLHELQQIVYLCSGKELINKHLIEL